MLHWNVVSLGGGTNKIRWLAVMFYRQANSINTLCLGQVKSRCKDL